MVRAHEVGTGLPVSHLFSSFSNSTITQNTGVIPETISVVSLPPLLERSAAPRSVLERHLSSVSLSSRQLAMDAIQQSFSASARDGSALVFVLGAGALAKNVKLGFTLGEGAFAGLANMSARARVMSGAFGALTLAGCDQAYQGEHTGGVNWPASDAGVKDAGSVDGGEDAFVNHPPTLKAEDELSLQTIVSISGKEGEIVGILLRGYDEDNDPLIYSLESPPVGSRVDTFQETDYYGMFSWKPDYQQAGHYSLKFKVEDTHGASAYSEVQVDIANAIPDADGDGWADDKDCAPNDPKKFPLHDDPNYSTDNNIKNGDYTICPGTYHKVTIIGDNATIHGENVTLEGNFASISAIAQMNAAKLSTYTGFTIQNYKGDRGAIYVASNDSNTFKDITIFDSNIGIYLDTSDNNLIQGLKMFNVGEAGVVLTGFDFHTGKSSDNNIIKDCEIHSINHNSPTNSDSVGILVETGVSNNIHSNLITGFDVNMYLGAYGLSVLLNDNGNLSAQNNDFQENVMHSALITGILILGYGGNNFTYNVVTNNKVGISLNACGDPGNVFTWNNFLTGNAQSIIDQSVGFPNCIPDADVTRIKNPANHNLY